MKRIRTGLPASSQGLLARLSLLVGVALATPLRAAGPLDWSASAGSGVPATRACFSDNVRVTGYLLARRESYVMMNVEGFRITEVLAQEGDTVTAGQEVLRLTRLGPDDPAAAPPPAAGAAAAAARAAPPRTISLRAPAAGVVSRNIARVGALTSAQSEPLMRVTSDSEVEAIVEIPSLYVTKVRAGAPARVFADAGTEFAGTVRLPATDVDPATQFGRARLSLPTDPALRPGLFVRALIDMGRSCGVAVPRTAVIRQNDAASVQVVKDGRIESRRVRIGLSSDDKVEVREGLAEGEAVLANAGLAF